MVSWAARPARRRLIHLPHWRVTVRLRVVLAAFAALAVLAAARIYVEVHSLSGGQPVKLPATQECVETANGSKATPEPQQMANTANIAAVAIRRRLPPAA